MLIVLLWREMAISRAKIIPISLQMLMSPYILFRYAIMGKMSTAVIWHTDLKEMDEHRD